jgi:hypothetical protein
MATLRRTFTRLSAALSSVAHKDAAAQDALRALVEQEVVGRMWIVRDGIEYIFEERVAASTLTYATRRVKPIRRAFFLVFDSAKATAWMNDGVVPANETRTAVCSMQKGIWPEQLRRGTNENMQRRHRIRPVAVYTNRNL